jgi:very-short-patch-repair endonuclease
VGLKFRRQVEIAGYFVDFCCPSRKLVVELDGGQHGKQIAYDQRRTRLLEAKGYTVIRFWNSEVLDKIEGVPDAILATIERVKSSRPSP